MGQLVPLPLEKLNKTQAALLKKLEASIKTPGGTKRKAPTKSPKKTPTKKAKKAAEAEEEEEEEEDVGLYKFHSVYP
jgi:hypothetical protein